MVNKKQPVPSRGPNSRDRRRVVTETGGQSRTKQAFKRECDVNEILARYRETGAIEHVARFAPQYGEVPSQTFYEAMNTVADSRTMFEELPSRIRKRFGNDPGQFLAFVEHADNPADAIIALGEEDRNIQRNTASSSAKVAEVPSAATGEPASEARQSEPTP